MPKNSQVWRFFWKVEICCQTVLPDRSILIEQKLVKMPKHKNSNATFLAIFKHCEILTLLLKSGNTVAINCLVIKLAGHSELTTKTVFCCHFFSFKPFVFKFRVPLAKKGFLWLLRWSYCQHLFFQRLWIFQEIKSDILKRMLKLSCKNEQCKISFLVIRYLHIIRWHELSALRKKSSKEHLVFPLNLMRQFWFLQP